MPIKYGFSADALHVSRHGATVALSISPKIPARKAEISAFLRRLELGQVAPTGVHGIKWEMRDFVGQTWKTPWFAGLRGAVIRGDQGDFAKKLGLCNEHLKNVGNSWDKFLGEEMAYILCWISKNLQLAVQMSGL